MGEVQFIAMYERHRRAILRYAASRVGAEAGEDVTAATFIEAWRRSGAFDAERASEAAWLFGIANNVLARHRREEAIWLRNRALATRTEDELRVEPDSGRSELIDAMALLHPRERDPLLLFAVADLSYEDVAAALGVPIGTVRSRISRGSARLRTQLDGVLNGR